VKPKLRVAFLTGRSDPRTCRLTPVQAAFLAALPVAAEAKYPLNFPYVPGAAPYVPVPLALASVRNGGQFVASRFAPFRARHRPAFLAFVEGAERTVFLAGSCGLEFLNNLALPASALGRVAAFAYGPVARRRPACAHVLVGSPHDAISRLYFKEPDIRVDATHLDYLTSPAVAAACTAFLARVTGDA
jgi:hypothetical protein